jgi:hypothetical protein
MRRVCFRWRGFAGSILSSRDRRQRQINAEYVSVIDMKIEIEISTYYNFDRSCICPGYSVQHSDIFLITSSVRKNEKRSMFAGSAHPNVEGFFWWSEQ